MGPGCARIRQSKGTDPQGELEYAKQDVDSSRDGMLILKKQKMKEVMSTSFARERWLEAFLTTPFARRNLSHLQEKGG